jgi:hypothetical protein
MYHAPKTFGGRREPIRLAHRRRAVVLGAGASAAYGDSLTGLRMPLARTFLAAFNELPQAHHPWVHLHGLYNYLRHHKGVDPWTFLSESHDIEELHSEIYEAALASLAPELTPEAIINFSAHHQLIFLFAYIVNLIQNGPVSPVHLEIARHLNSGDGILTFNWDTLMDRALAECSDWQVDTGYGISPQAVFRDEWTRPVATAGSRELSLWKLHGSSNWITSHEQFENGEIIRACQEICVWGLA